MLQEKIRLLQTVAGSYNVPLQLYHREGERIAETEGRFDGGIRAWCWAGYREADYLTGLFARMEERTVYHMEDGFGCRYLLLREGALCLSVGPYLLRANTPEQTRALQPDWDEEMTRSLLEYRNGQAVVQDEEAFILLIRRLGAEDGELPLRSRSAETPADVRLQTREKEYEQAMAASMIEERYRAENLWLDAMTTGDDRQMERQMRRLSRYQLPGRFDTLRGSKNMAIILNTLCRKNLERSHVHPVHIDAISKELADRIERCCSVEEVHQLQRQMVRQYCGLVRSQAVGDYSPLITGVMQQALLHLDGEFSLCTLAADAGVTLPYLSARFKKEVGVSFSDWLRQVRVERAKELLLQPELRVSEVAERVGLLDPSYFIRVFRRETGQTPGEYRSRTVK
jgi:AraC-like DNA-binding protein